MNFTFTTRAEYKTQRAEWFAEYEQQIKLIRKLKVDYKEAQRANKPVGAIERQQRVARRDLQAMVSQRFESRQEAHRQYKASITVNAG